MARGITETATFRFDQKTLASLKQEAKIKNLSLNSLVNNIIYQYLDWFSDSRDTNHVHVWKIIPIKLLERNSYNEIRKIAREVYDIEMKNTLIVLREKFEMPSFFDALHSWLKASRFTYRYERTEIRHKFVIQFNMSKKWSFLLSEIFRHICNELSVKYKCSAGEKSLIVEIGTDFHLR